MAVQTLIIVCTVITVLAIVVSAALLAFMLRQIVSNAVTSLEKIAMNIQDIPTHIQPMLAAIVVSFADQTAILKQIKDQNTAGNQDNTLVDQAIANIDSVTQQATAAHAAVSAALATVTISPTSASVAANGTEQFSATASDGSTPSWTSDVGTVDSTGLFTAGANPGSGTVTATLANGATASASVTVS